jgi:predicted MFS family arabinose efflux permease
LTGSIGELIGPTFVGAIVDLFDFTAAFYVIACMCAASSVAAFSLPPTQEATKPEMSKATPVRMGFGGLIVHPGIQAALWGTAIVALLQGFLRGFVPVLLYGKYSATKIGALFFVASVASLIGRSAVGWRSERWSPTRVLPLCAIVAASAVALIPFSPQYSLIAASMAFYGIGQGLVAVLGTVLIAENVAAEERGLANGLRLTMMRTGGTAGPLLFGPLAGIFSVVFAFAAIGGASAAVAALLLVSASLKHGASPKQKLGPVD